MNSIVWLAGLFAVLVGVTAVLRIGGARRWARRTRALRARLDAARAPITPNVVDLRETDALPAPVRRYLRGVLRDGAPIVAAVRVAHRGTFNAAENAERWRPFVSDQVVVTRRPGFDWDARIAMLPGVPVRVHDAYVDGEGILQAAILGLVSVADLRDRGEVARGEFMRFFAEAAWYPTALLPSRGVRWEPVDDRSARGTLEDGEISATLVFSFDEDGLLTTVRAEARGRSVGGSVVPTPWEGRFQRYEDRGGMRVPLDGEVSWVLPGGALPYWRGTITRIEYEWAG